VHKYLVRVTDPAIKDIEKLAEFYFELIGEESAAKFADDVIATLESLDTFPEKNSFFDKEHNLRRVLVRNHKVSVVYIVDNGVYEVVAFGAFHTSGEPSKYTEELISRLKVLEK
jgi:plasmid stabilization system protein ParE